MLAEVILRQIAIMALLMAVGVILSKAKMLREESTKDLGAILLRLIIPCVIVKSYITEYTQERLYQLGASMLLALTGFTVAMLISWVVFGKRKRIENFAASFCNAGFIGIPLAQAVIGEEGVFFMAASIALLNLFQWTYGVYIMTDRKDAISIKAILKNPVVIAILLGIALFLTQLPVPEIVTNALGLIAGMNTPIAMLLLGTYMARLPVKQFFFDKRAYLCVLFRLVIIPLVVALVYMWLPVQDTQVKMAAFLAAVTPVGANICVFAQQNHCDYELSVITVCLSTVLSAVTIPLMFVLAQNIL